MTTMRGTRNCYYFLMNFVIQGLKALRAMSQLLLFFYTSCNCNLDEYDDNENNVLYRSWIYKKCIESTMTTTCNVGADQKWMNHWRQWEELRKMQYDFDFDQCHNYFKEDDDDYRQCWSTDHERMNIRYLKCLKYLKHL